VAVRAFISSARDLAAQGPRQVYWNTSALASELRNTFKHGSAGFRRWVRRDFLAYFTGGRAPIKGETEERAHAAAGWLFRAQKEGGDGGASYGYFPGVGEPGGWKPSYPETTGYIMSALIDYGRRFPERADPAAVLRMAQWEARVQMANGAVQGGQVCPPEKQTAAAFNTGMVLDGWCSVIEKLGDRSIYDAAKRAADWLADDVDERGYFRTNGAFVSRDAIKTYTCLCAWALYRFGEISGTQRYRDVAIRVIESAIKKQEANGWFRDNCLTRPDAPLTHTIGYALQGILEVGVLAGRKDFIEAVQRSIAELMRIPDADGYLAGRLDRNWKPANLSSCLTGSAQIAIVAFRLFQLTGNKDYARFGHLLVNYLKPLQALECEDASIIGALPGSFPIFGGYMRGGYPNWATKYFLDALLLQLACQDAGA
jgi:hypothetical protein